MIRYPETLICCPLVRGYTIEENPTTSVKSALKGRTRYTLEDTNPVLNTSITLDLTTERFAAWQSFWKAIGNGEDWFIMDLVYYSTTKAQFEVHAKGPYSVSMIGFGSYVVSFDLEIVP